MVHLIGHNYIVQAPVFIEIQHTCIAASVHRYIITNGIESLETYMEL